MTDIVDQQTRSRMMAGIRGKDTKPELVLRRALHARGFRFRLHSKAVHGRPDLVLPKYAPSSSCMAASGIATRAAATPPPIDAPGVLAGEVRRECGAGQRRSGHTSGRRMARGDGLGVRPAGSREQVQVAADLLAALLRGGAAEVEIGETELVAERALMDQALRGRSGMIRLRRIQTLRTPPVKSVLRRNKCVKIQTLASYSPKLRSHTGPENIGPERPLPGLLAPGPVLSPSRITLENNEKIRPQPDRENAFARASGGGDGPDVQPSPP